MCELQITLAALPTADAAKELLELVRYLHEKIIDASLDNTVLSIRFRESLGVDMDAVSTSVRELAGWIGESFAKDFGETVYSSAHCPTFTGNPWSHLVNAGLILPVQAGICYLSGSLAELLECADLHFKNYAATLGATLQSYSSIIPFSAAVTNGYLANFPQHVFFVASAHQSLSALKQLAQIKPTDTTPNGRELGAVRYILAPTVCYHCFEALRGQTVEEPKVFSARAVCHRNELYAVDSLLRLQTFNMREIIFYGDAAFVEATRGRVLKHCLALCDFLKLKYRVQTASDPFFVSGAEQRRVFQKLTRSKLELQLYIPYRDLWVSVASFNHHAMTLTRKYSVGPSGLNSGCFGVGYERMLYAMIAQLGCDIDEMARTLRRAA